MHVMYSKSDNIDIMINDEAGEITKKPFDSLKNNKNIRIFNKQ